MRGTWTVAVVGLTMVGLSGCGGPIEEEGSEGQAPISSTAELKNNGGGGTGPSCSASGNPPCSVTCSANQIAVCSDAICIVVFPGICIPSGAASCSCKTRSATVYQFSTSQTGTAGGGAVELAP